ncbi:MAG: hypothetical protein J7L08_01115 [Candidatus Aenigmarchaeota archaeon]|nr:hypothetical protein [Candidatus Aenigmarchaeota archaeon]
MNKLQWCKNKKNGIRIVDINENLAKEYIKKSENSLKMMAKAPSEEWKIVAAYYACYEALYSLLQKTGMKCEIHDCTIHMMKFFDFNKEYINFLKNLKEKRINAQYYVAKNVKLQNEKMVKDFVLKCKEILEKSDFRKIRKKVQIELSQF